jgi:hypothetical protein
VLTLLAACGPVTEQSPPTLEEMTRAGVTDFWSDAEEGHVADLRAWLEENKASETEGYYFDTLTEDVVADIEHDPDVIWEECFGAGVVMRLDGTLADYGAAAVEADQSFADFTYSEWTRCTLEGDTDAFLAGAELSTDNHVEKTNLDITIPYDMYKDFRWFGDTLASLTWVPRAGYNELGDNGIVAGFTLEIMYEDDEGVVWYNGQWSDLDTILDEFMTEEGALDLLIDGTRDYMEGTEEHVLAGLEAPRAEACP